MRDRTAVRDAEDRGGVGRGCGSAVPVPLRPDSSRGSVGPITVFKMNTRRTISRDGTALENHPGWGRAHDVGNLWPL